MRLQRKLGIALLGAALILPATAHAQWTPQGAPQAAPQGAPPQSEPAPPTVEQRIQMLHTQLGIAPQQESVWNNFAQSMRDNATETERLAQQRSATVATLNAVDNMRSYARIAHEYAADADRLTAAFERLYAALSPAQRQAADTLLRQQGAPGQ